jgi:[acyl-carrier-protein] S-malonyltransferase
MKSCAFLFPGQGAQYPGMGRDLVERFRECRDILARAETHLKFPLGEIMFQGPKERLNQDFTAQVAVYTVSCMVAVILEARGIRASAIAGYSSGLYAAACAAGVFDFETGLSLMQEADRCIRKQNIEGTMGVILGLSPSEVKQLCLRAPSRVEVSIFHTNHQTLVSGKWAAVETVLELANSAGALKTERLSATAPYHCSLLKKADRCLAQIVRQTSLANPHTPIISYLDCQSLMNALQVAHFLSDQLSSPVHWVGVVEELVHRGLTFMVEVGPGQMLGRSVRWIHRKAMVFSTETNHALGEVIEYLNGLAVN